MSDREQGEQEIRTAMGTLAKAMIERDVDGAAACLDDEFTGSDPGGMVVSKDQWLRDLASGELTFHSITSDEIEFIHADENTVHVRGQLTFDARYTKSSYNGAFRYLGVYARRDGGWKLRISTARRVAAE
jgi:ketosteroid isomerase-like protein